MKRYFEKHETLICILLIIIYVITNSYCMQNYGLMDYRTLVLNFILSLVIIVFIVKNRLGKHYGLTKFAKPKDFLYFVPLILIVSVNLWNGINVNHSVSKIIFYILTMFCVGFLEEIIFRGFLFKMIEKENVNRAVVITSLTFGVGHVVNLLSGADFLATLMQVCYAFALGFLFVTIFQKSGSLWPCIIAHAFLNAFAIFNNVANVVSLYIVPVFLVVCSLWYALYIRKKYYS